MERCDVLADSFKSVFKILYELDVSKIESNGFLFETDTGVKGLLTVRHVLCHDIHEVHYLNFLKIELFNSIMGKFILGEIFDSIGVLQSEYDFIFFPLSESFCERMEKGTIKFLKEGNYFDNRELVMPKYDPNMLELSICRGLCQDDTNRNMIRHDIESGPGNSGSPLLNIMGDVVALHLGIIRQRDNSNLCTDNTKYAIKICAIQSIIHNIQGWCLLVYSPNQNKDPQGVLLTY